MVLESMLTMFCILYTWMLSKMEVGKELDRLNRGVVRKKERFMHSIGLNLYFEKGM